MNVAKDVNGNIIWIEDAIKGNKYFCPKCNSELIVKEGSINIKHFAHKSLKDCDSWGSEMSKWHLDWQKRFPIECREVVINVGDKTHRADVCIGRYVIEFQNSPLSCAEFDERTKFYTDAGYKVIWIFNFKEKYDRCLIHKSYGKREDLFIWEHSVKTFTNLDLYRKDVLLYFELFEDNDKYEPALHHIIWSPILDDETRTMKCFIVSGKGPFRKSNFVKYVSAGFA